MNNNREFSPSLSKKGNRELIFILCWKAVLKYRMDTDHQKMLSKQSFELAISWIRPNRQNNIGWQLKTLYSDGCTSCIRRNCVDVQNKTNSNHYSEKPLHNLVFDTL